MVPGGATPGYASDVQSPEISYKFPCAFLDNTVLILAYIFLLIPHKYAVILLSV